MTKKNVILLCLGTFILGASVTGIFTWQPWQSTPPRFAFNQQLVPNWWSGDNSNPRESWNADEYMGDQPIDEMEVAAINVMHGSAGTSAADNCFVMYSYYDYLPNSIAEEYQKYEDQKSAFSDGIAFERIGVSQQSITTFEGDIPYELRQYKLVNKPVETSLEGYQIGFAALSSGYVRIEGVCKAGDDLSKTLDVFRSVRLNKN